MTPLNAESSPIRFLQGPVFPSKLKPAAEESAPEASLPLMESAAGRLAVDFAPLSSSPSAALALVRAQGETAQRLGGEPIESQRYLSTRNFDKRGPSEAAFGQRLPGMDSGRFLRNSAGSEAGRAAGSAGGQKTGPGNAAGDEVGHKAGPSNSAGGHQGGRDVDPSGNPLDTDVDPSGNPLGPSKKGSGAETPDTASDSKAPGAESPPHKQPTKGPEGKNSPLPQADGQSKDITLTAGGRTAQAKLTKVKRDGNHELYEVTIDGHKFQLKLHSKMSPQQMEWATQRALEELTKIPPHLRTPVKKIRVEAGPDPLDAAREKARGVKGTAAASAGGGRINIFKGGGGPENDQIGAAFSHEVGHLVAQSIDQKKGPLDSWLGDGDRSCPTGWRKAIQDEAPVDTGLKVEKDGKTIDYSQVDAGEDFGEAFQLYVAAHNAGPEALEAFRKKYPKRAAILAKIFAGRVDL